ncbi:MAG TPA: PAS domain-containing protein, partial [Planctomycetia bacterium]|nr:PAS domain-containing protein [Planctomycetia bacterium]
MTAFDDELWLIAVFDRSPSPMALLDMEGRLRRFNGAFARLFPRAGERDQVLRLFGDAQRAALETAAKKVTEVGRFRGKLVIPDATPSKYECSWYRLRSPGRPGPSVFVLTPDQGDSAAEELRKQAERYETAFRVASDGVWDWHLASGAMAFSPRWGELLGRGAGSIGRTIADWLPLVHPDDAGALGEALDACRRGLANSMSVEARHRCVDGSYKEFLVRGVVVRSEAGAPERLVGVLADVTELRAARSREQAQREEVAHLSRMQAVGELAASLAHDLAQPLGAIVNYARGCEAQAKEWAGAPPEFRESLAFVVRNALYAGEVLHRVRRYVERREPASSMVRLEEVAKEAIALFQYDASRDGIEFALEVENGLEPVFGEAVLIEQALVNLLRNSLDALRRHGEG